MPAESLYLHIPFCSSICFYCDFVKLLYKDEWAFPYVDELLRELETKYPSRKFKTIYIGGGTPNTLPLPLLEHLLKALSTHLEERYEWTIECNPERVTAPLVDLLVCYGVNRVSMGMETSSSCLLQQMGRHHDFKAVQTAVALLQEKGIENISIDMIYALPNQTKEMLEEDLLAILSLHVPHISAYSYIQEDHSIWTHMGIKEASSDIQGEYLQIVEETLLKEGYAHYEISSYCKDGKQSKHNLAYWKDHEYGALGLGASGYENGVRYKNTSSLTKYLRHEYLSHQEIIEKKDDISYYLLTNLRLKEGFDLDEFKARFGYDFYQEKRDIVEEEVRLGMLEIIDNHLCPTYLGMRLLDSVLLKLL